MLVLTSYCFVFFIILLCDVIARGVVAHAIPKILLIRVCWDMIFVLLLLVFLSCQIMIDDHVPIIQVDCEESGGSVSESWCVAHLRLHVLPWMDIHEPTFTRCRPRPGPGFGPLGWSGLRAQLPIGAKKPSTLDWFGPLQCFKRNLYIMTKNWPKKKYHDQKKKRNLYMYKNEKENILSYIFVNSYTPYVMSCLNWIFFLLYPLFLEINYYAWCKKVVYRRLIISYM